MKKILLVLSVFLMVIGVAGIASALPFQAVNSNDVWFNSNNPSERWIFDLDNDVLAVGDVNAEDIILPPTFLSIDFYDDEIDKKKISTQEYAGTYLDGYYSFTFSGEIDPGTQSTGLLSSILLTGLVFSDHKLVIDMYLEKGGDFGVSEIRLTGNYCDVPGAAPVPEPATMLLLGSGLVGLAGFGRRKFFKKG